MTAALNLLADSREVTYSLGDLDFDVDVGNNLPVDRVKITVYGEIPGDEDADEVFADVAYTGRLLTASGQVSKRDPTRYRVHTDHVPKEVLDAVQPIVDHLVASMAPLHPQETT